MGLILVSYDPLHTISVPALVDPITVREQFAHHHRLATSYAVESSRAPLVEQKPEVNTPCISFFLHILSISKSERLPIGSVLRSRLVLEIAASNYRWAVAFRNINRVLGVGHLDSRAAARRRSMASRDGMVVIMMNWWLMSSGHCSPFQHLRFPESYFFLPVRGFSDVSTGTGSGTSTIPSGVTWNVTQ